MGMACTAHVHGCWGGTYLLSWLSTASGPRPSGDGTWAAAGTCNNVTVSETAVIPGARARARHMQGNAWLTLDRPDHTLDHLKKKKGAHLQILRLALLRSHP